MTKTDQKMLDKYKARIKRQNNAIKENYDRVSATLPKGTVDRINALGLSINGVINDSVLAFLDCAEESAEEGLPHNPIQTAQNAEISVKTETVKEYTKEPEKPENKADSKLKTANYEPVDLIELQALIDAKKANQDKVVNKDLSCQKEAEELLEEVGKLRQE